MSDPSAGNPKHSQYGEQLLGQLAREKAGLPTRTLFTLVLGGLRVRLMRSAVTVVSVVLAIAFFTYAGLNTQLYQNTAMGVQSLERVEAVPTAEIEAATDALAELGLIKTLSSDQQRRLAVAAELDRTEPEQEELTELRQQHRAAIADREEAADHLAELEAADAPAAAELRTARQTLEHHEGQVESLARRISDLEARVELGRWIGRGGENAEMQRRLTAALEAYQAELFQRAAAVALTDSDLAALEHLLAWAGDHGGDAAAVATLERVVHAERARHQVTRLRRHFSDAGISVQATLEGEAADWWLIVMALLTCSVGIANAMLMSVTERFREIGTMKCLGAPDGLVVKLFLLESSFLGVIGAAAGIVLGVLVALLGAMLQFGGFGISYFPRLEAGQVLAGSIVVGVLLAVLGAVYPAAVAARMNPVDALRVEE